MVIYYFFKVMFPTLLAAVIQRGETPTSVNLNNQEHTIFPEPTIQQKTSFSHFRRYFQKRPQYLHLTDRRLTD